MSALVPEQLPALAAALIRLRGDTLSRVAQATGIRAANLSVWMRGKEQVISEKRLVGLLHHLGVTGGRLRDDQLHLWRDEGGLGDCKAALTTLLDHGKPWWLFGDEQPGLVRTRFLLAGRVLVRVQVEPGVTAAADLADVIEVDRLLTVSVPLADVPTDSCVAARDALLTLAEQAATDIGDEELLSGLVQQLSEDYAAELGYNAASPRGWRQLDAALRTAFNAGASPGNIASVLDAHYRAGGRADMPPKR